MRDEQKEEEEKEEERLKVHVQQIELPKNNLMGTLPTTLGPSLFDLLSAPFALTLE